MLWTPPCASHSQKFPGIVLCHGWGGIRNHLDVRYASKFAAQGFKCLTFDYAGWGDSDGRVVSCGEDHNVQNCAREQDFTDQVPQESTIRVRVVRQTVDMMWQVEDIDAAVSFLSSEPNVTRVGIWGTSQGGGHVLWHTARDDRVAAVVSQVPSMGRRGAGEPAKTLGQSSREAAAKAARSPVPWYPAGAREHHLPAMDGAPILRKAYEYDPISVVGAIRVPTLIIDVDKEELWDRLDNGKRAFDIISANGVSAKYALIANANHYDAYDKDAELSRKLAIDFFKANLSGGEHVAKL